MTALEHAMNGSNDHPELGIRYQLIEIRAYAKATALWAKVAAALIGMFIAAMTLYFVSLEARGKVGEIFPRRTTGQVLNAHVDHSQETLNHNPADRSR